MPPSFLFDDIPGLWHSLLDFAYPAHCYLCGKHLEHPEFHFCPNCLEGIPVLEGPYCVVCRQPVDPGITSSCCNSPLTWVYSGWEYTEPVSVLVHKFKYEGKTKLGSRVARHLSDAVLELIRQQSMEVLAPVPLHIARLRERGYNQSSLVARQFAQVTGIRLCDGLLKRRVNTKDQTHLSALQRKENVAGAFSVRVKGGSLPESVMLVDDVITTGATMLECARTLTQAGVSRVYGVTLAKAVFHDSLPAALETEESPHT